MKIDSDSPLRSDEVRRLGEFLDSSTEMLSLFEAEGFLAAIASAPTFMPPSVWHEEVFGGHAFESMEEASEVLDLTMRLFNQVVRGLDSGNARWVTNFQDEMAAQMWCTGYLLGSRMDQKWAEDEMGLLLLFPLGVLSGEFDLRGEEDSSGRIIEDPSTNEAPTLHKGHKGQRVAGCAYLPRLSSCQAQRQRSSIASPRERDLHQQARGTAQSHLQKDLGSQANWESLVHSAR